MALPRAFPAGGVDDRPEVDDPAEEDEPEGEGEDEVDERGEDAALHELAEAGDEEAAHGSDDVSCGALSGLHGA